MPWTDDEIEQWIVTALKNARFQLDHSRMLLSLVHCRTMLVAMCPICSDAAFFADMDMDPAFYGNHNEEIFGNSTEAYVVRSPCDAHKDSRGILSAAERCAFDELCRSLTRFASKIFVLANSTRDIHLIKVTRRQLLSSHEKLRVYHETVASGRTRSGPQGDSARSSLMRTLD